jgi:hypothetical protein
MMSCLGVLREKKKNNFDMAVGVRIGTNMTNNPCMTNEM